MQEDDPFTINDDLALFEARNELAPTPTTSCANGPLRAVPLKDMPQFDTAAVTHRCADAAEVKQLEAAIKVASA